jgi:hypothetical protein
MVLGMRHSAAGATRRCPMQPSTPLGPDQVNVLLLLLFWICLSDGSCQIEYWLPVQLQPIEDEPLELYSAQLFDLILLYFNILFANRFVIRFIIDKTFISNLLSLLSSLS